jgi:hypothetical protein
MTLLVVFGDIAAPASVCLDDQKPPIIGNLVGNRQSVREAFFGEFGVGSKA